MKPTTRESPPRCAIYARVSKPDGSQNPDNQLRELRSFATHSGWTVTFEYIDRQTGSTLDRPQLAAMLQAADRKLFDVLLFWRFDRLTRSGILDTLEIIRTLDHCGIQYHSYTEPDIRSAGPMGKLMVSFIATVASIEREANRERTLAGLARAKEQGKVLGRPRRVADVKKLVQWRAEGRTTEELARLAGISSSTAARRLRDYARQAK